MSPLKSKTRSDRSRLEKLRNRMRRDEAARKKRMEARRAWYLNPQTSKTTVVHLEDNPKRKITGQVALLDDKFVGERQLYLTEEEAGLAARLTTVAQALEVVSGFNTI